MNRIVLLVATLLILVACGSQTATHASGVNMASPEAVHTAWVNAVRNNDRQATLAVVGVQQEYREVFVDQTLSYMQHVIADQTNGVVKTGPLLGVDILSVVDAGAGKTGYSAWRFQNVTFCRVTNMAAVGNDWKVIDWTTARSCPQS